jgi:type IV secretion system protein VirB6
MGFFAEFSAWLNGILATYIGDNTARVGAAIEPAVVTLGTIYVMIWGYLHLTGQMEEPFITGMKRIAALAIIFGVALRLWLYNTLLVDTFFNAPGQLAAVVIGAFDSVGIVDGIIDSGADTGQLLLSKGGLFSQNITFDIAGIVVYALVAITAIYTIFLLTLSRVALSVLLALGPLFIALLMFDSTKRFFESWLAQLANYALIDSDRHGGDADVDDVAHGGAGRSGY